MIVGGSKCAMADKDCRGRLEFHHAVKQQRLKRTFPHGAWWDEGMWQPIPRQVLGVVPSTWVTVALDDILGDTRNRIWACSHHHELVTNGRLKVQLPDSVWIFAREYGLEGMLENDIRRAA